MCSASFTPIDRMMMVILSMFLIQAILVKTTLYGFLSHSYHRPHHHRHLVEESKS